MTRFLRSPLALVVTFIGIGCSSIVAPYVKGFAPLNPELDPLLYVVANDEYERVVSALRSVGFKTTTNLTETPLVLNAKLGGRRANRHCGSLRNLSFDLRHGSGVRIATVKARGWTGRCQPNMILEASAQLATLFLSVH